MDHLLTKIERAIDTHPSLTRQPFHRRNSTEPAQLLFDRSGWTAQIRVRSLLAHGRGAKLLHLIWSTGESPEAAVEALLRSLPSWTEALR